MQKCALRATSGHDHAMEILVGLALAVGDVTSLLTLGTIFLGADKGKKLRSRSLLLKLVMCFDQLVGQINTKKAARKKTKEVSKWQCEVCGCLSPMSSQICEMCAAARVDSDDQVEEHETKQPENSLHVIKGALQNVQKFKDCVMESNASNVYTYEIIGLFIFQLVDSLAIVYLMIDKDVQHNRYEPFMVNLFPSTMRPALSATDTIDSSVESDISQETQSHIQLFNLMGSFLAVSFELGTQQTYFSIPYTFIDYAKDTVNKKVLRDIAMCFLRVLKVNLRRQASIWDSLRKGRRNSNWKIRSKDEKDIHLLGNALMNAYDSPTFANDNGILSEVLAIRLELDKSQGLAKVFMMMASYPNNLPLQIGGCRAIQSELQSVLQDGQIDPQDPLLLMFTTKGSEGLKCLLNAVKNFWNDFAILRPALTVLSQIPSVLDAIVDDDVWGLMIKITRNAIQNEFVMLSCVKIFSRIVGAIPNSSLSVMTENTRTTTNLIINALRNHLDSDLQEYGISVLNIIASRQEMDIMWRYIRYLIDAGGVHSTVAAIILLENRPSAKRLGLNLLTICMVDETCFDDIPVPVALDCMRQNPNDSLMQINGLNFAALDNIPTKRHKFKRLEGLSVLYHAMAPSYDDKRRDDDERRLELAVKCLKMYMKLSQDDERTKFGLKSGSGILSMFPNRLVTIYQKYTDNTEIMVGLIVCFFLAFRALADGDAATTLISQLDAKIVVNIMDKTLESLRIQQDCMWMLNFMANSKRDEIAKAGGFAAIVKAMKRWNEDEKVQLFGCIAIMNVSGERGGGRGKKARSAGCEAAVKNACEYLESNGDKESLAAAKLAYKRMNKSAS